MNYDKKCKWHKSCGYDFCHGEGICPEFEKGKPQKEAEKESRMNKVKFTIEMPANNYCGECPCLGLNGNEEEHCGYFNKPLNCKGQKVIKCDECKLMTKMLIAESEVEHDG